ncbi:hypothetical protein Pcinc_008315 [Petrolisthes cinctipes]|uniref:Uncharacterized protein n=1 Tax=Petrolisthes cinctipes TaxID=88211 RepID=A0AAE1G9J2_PETCI|nr:hypothetical protein Pcinc_008315 [Petrolisthes cinctipes]
MFIEQHPHPQTLGEGQAVDHQDILTEDLVKPTQPEGGPTHAKGRDGYAPPRSTRHKGASGQSATSNVLFHHDWIHTVASHPQYARISGSREDHNPSVPQSGIPGSSQDPFYMEVPEDHWEVFPEDDSGTKDNSEESSSTPIPHSMMSYIVQCFPEALGYKEKAHRPAPPGEVRQVEDKHI